MMSNVGNDVDAEEDRTPLPHANSVVSANVVTGSVDAAAVAPMSSNVNNDNEEDPQAVTPNNHHQAVTPNSNPPNGAMPSKGGTTKKKRAPKPFDGYRGVDLQGRVLGGWWISLEDATKKAKAPWWTRALIDGKVVKPVQHVKDAPAEKPVWLYEDKGMYLGEWTEKGSGGHPVEHGFGIWYTGSPNESKGLILIGEFRDGVARGHGETFFLESAKAWQENRHGASRIKAPGPKGKPRGLPYHYIGEFQKGLSCDMDGAIVVLKDGTTRKGVWDEGKPEGDWWNDHEIVDIPVKMTKQNNNDTAPDGGQNAAATTNKSNQAHQTPAKKKRKVYSTAAKRPATPIQPTMDSKRRRSQAQKPAAHGGGKGSVGIKKEEGVIEILSSDTEEHSDASVDGDQKPAATTAQVANPEEVSSGGSAEAALSSEEEEARRIPQISDWITQEVIRLNPIRATMNLYATKLCQEGYQSVEFIKAYLTVEDVQSYDWMKPLHKKIFQKRISAGW